jgi:hypothetical protein
MENTKSTFLYGTLEAFATEFEKEDGAVQVTNITVNLSRFQRPNVIITAWDKRHEPARLMTKSVIDDTLELCFIKLVQHFNL